VTDDQRTIALQQLANIVIDAYFNRDKQFVPDFEPGTTGVMYLSRPEDGKDHPDLRTDIWYDRSDYQTTGPASAKKAKRSSEK
jgi:hypothetical protein